MTNYVSKASNMKSTTTEMVQAQALKYTVIKTREQYDRYCLDLEQLLAESPEKEDEIELLTLLIEKWDETQSPTPEQDPIQLLFALMKANDLMAKDLAEILELTKGTVSKILNYQKGLSKQSIRKLSQHFKISQAAFNRPYPLKANA